MSFQAEHRAVLKTTYWKGLTSLAPLARYVGTNPIGSKRLFWMSEASDEPVKGRTKRLRWDRQASALCQAFLVISFRTVIMSLYRPIKTQNAMALHEKWPGWCTKISRRHRRSTKVTWHFSRWSKEHADSQWCFCWETRNIDDAVEPYISALNRERSCWSIAKFTDTKSSVRALLATLV